MKTLSDLPTDRAMKDIERGKISPAIKKVIEVMALNKQDLVRAMRVIEFRERLQAYMMKAQMSADRAIRDYMTANPNYDL